MCADTVYSHKVGYNENCAKYAPTILLIDHTYNRYLNSKDVKYFNLISDSAWQNRWHPQRMQVFNLYCFNKTLSGMLAYANTRARKYISHHCCPVNFPRFAVTL